MPSFSRMSARRLLSASLVTSNPPSNAFSSSRRLATISVDSNASIACMAFFDSTTLPAIHRLVASDMFLLAQSSTA